MERKVSFIIEKENRASANGRSLFRVICVFFATGFRGWRSENKLYCAQKPRNHSKWEAKKQYAEKYLTKILP